MINEAKFRHIVYLLEVLMKLLLTAILMKRLMEDKRATIYHLDDSENVVMYFIYIIYTINCEKLNGTAISFVKSLSDDVKISYFFRQILSKIF